MSLTTIRYEIADALRAGLDPKVNVYPYPAETVALPAVVIVPSSPWWTPGRLGQSALERVLVHMDLQIIHPRTEVEEGIKALEALVVAVGLVITQTGIRWIDLDGVEPLEVNKIVAMKTVLGIQVYV